MAKKEKSRRRTKKDMLQYLEDAYDLTRLDYAKCIAPKKEKAKIIGLVVAFLIYGIVFAAAYYGWEYNNISHDLFVKTTWVLMVPASVMGVLAWLLTFNRYENVVQQEFIKLIKNIEADNGMLWRFKPLMSTFDPGNIPAKKVMSQSEAGEIDKIEAEDYANAVQVLFNGINSAESINPDTASEVEENFNSMAKNR